MPKIWKDDDLKRFQKELEADPTNIEKANANWNACGDYFRGDIRSGRFVMGTFRECALFSQQGVVVFTKAYRELYNLSGEYPRGKFDDELMVVINESLALLNEDDRKDVERLLMFLI